MPIINCLFLDDFNRMGLLRENKNKVSCNIYLTLLQATILKTEAEKETGKTFCASK
jgi:hypothetical protein